MGTHDNIRFPPPDMKLIPRTWLLLGQIQATVFALGSLPLLTDDAFLLNMLYLARGIHGTTAIEGNELSEEEVLELVQGDKPPAAGASDQQRQIINMLAAYEAVTADAPPINAPKFSVDLLNHYHQLAMDGLETDDAPVGEIRSHSVTVGRYLAPPADDCLMLLEKFCDWLNQEEQVSKVFKSYELAFAIMKAISAHVYLALIHPYADGNGRMARLIEFALLLRAGMPARAAHAFSYRYSRTRDRYYLELQDTHGDFIDGAYRELELGKFVLYALDEGMIEFETQLRWIESAQAMAIWRESIRRRFPVQLTAQQQRRLQLALDLSARFAAMPLEFKEIWDLLDEIPAGEFEYSINILDRDLSALVKMGILKSDFLGFQPNLDLVHRLFGYGGAEPR